MSQQAIVAVVAVLAVVAHVNAQWFDFSSQSGANGMTARVGQNANPWLNLANRNPVWGMNQQGGDNNEYLTCTGRNTDGDDLRVTFTMTNNNPWAGAWGQQGGSLRVNAQVSLSPSSSLQGQVELVVTRGSRSEEVCLSRALGEILDEQNWWAPSQRPIGIVGTPILITRGHTATISERVTRLQFRQLVGRGMALCPSNQIRGNTCVDVIPLCCKIGYDSQPATTPFTMPGQIFGQGQLSPSQQFPQGSLGGQFPQGSIGQRGPLGGPFSQAPLNDQFAQGPLPGQAPQGQFQPGLVSGQFQRGAMSGQAGPDAGMQLGMQPVNTNNNGAMVADQGFSPMGQGQVQGQGFSGQGSPQMNMGMPPMNAQGGAMNNGMNAQLNAGMMNDMNGGLQPNNGSPQGMLF